MCDSYQLCFALAIPALFLGATGTTAVTEGDIRSISQPSLTSPEWAQPIPSLLLRKPPPVTFMNTPEIIKYYGYPVETHSFTSWDGYKSTWFRIPFGKTGTADKECVVLFHGLLSSSDDMLLQPESSSLPFILADQGYDVWLGNVRGNSYSQGHTNMSTDSPAYWDFSFHEPAIYDFPVAFNYIRANTNRTQGKLSYVGHSMGCTMFFIAMDRHPELQELVRKMVALAPGVYFKHSKTPLAQIVVALFSSAARKAFFDILSGGRIVPKEINAYLKVIAPHFCYGNVTSKLCSSVMYAIAGPEVDTYPKEMVSNIVAHTPSDSAAKMLLHYLQWGGTSYVDQVDARLCDNSTLGGNQELRFAEYDYGCKENLKRYKATKPPLYSLGNNKVETMVLCGRNDNLVQPPDCLRIINELGNVNTDFTKLVADKVYNHLDFLYNDNVNEIVNNDIVRFLAA